MLPRPSLLLWASAAIAGVAALSLRLYPAASQPAPRAGLVAQWTLVGGGDCGGHDVGQSPGASQPDPRFCTPAAAGSTAVCWGTFYQHPGGFVGCTYKSTPAAQCRGGGAPGNLYECHASAPKPVGGAELFGPWRPGAGQFDGGNYAVIDAPSAAACLAQCGRDTRCGSVTWSPPGTLPGFEHKTCWMQTGAGELRPYAGVMTAVKRGAAVASAAKSVPAPGGEPPTPAAEAAPPPPGSGTEPAQPAPVAKTAPPSAPPAAATPIPAPAAAAAPATSRQPNEVAAGPPNDRKPTAAPAMPFILELLLVGGIAIALGRWIGKWLARRSARS